MPEFTIQQALHAAVRHRRAGNLHDAELLLRQILAEQPEHIGAIHGLGVIALQVGNFDIAAALIRQAIALKPDYVEAYGNLGVVLHSIGELDAALAAYRRALALDPGNSSIHSNLIWTLHFHPHFDANAIAAEYRRWNMQHAEHLRPAQGGLAHLNDRDPDRPLRIGYVSPDFCCHAVGQNVLPFFRQRDREQLFITCYSNVARPDVITREFQQLADVWRNVVDLSDEEMARQIRDDKIDILIDLTLHTANNRLLVFARKPAPVQATFAGCPASTGLSAIDYRFSDPFLAPPEMDLSIYSETTIRLPDTFWCYHPLGEWDIPITPLPALSAPPALSGAEAGASNRQQNVVTFGCLNNFCKINDGMLTLWAQVLRQVPGSRLYFLTEPGSHRQRTTDRLSQEGIDPGRLEFFGRRSRREYLQLHHRLDISLDSAPYNGHTTGLDSFWMGVPVVTIVGHTPVARAGLCMLSNLGLTELAAYTREDFVRIAVDLANDLPRLAALRATLRPRMEKSPLMDAPKFARSIEAAYRRMWRNWCSAQ